MSTFLCHPVEARSISPRNMMLIYLFALHVSFVPQTKNAVAPRVFVFRLFFIFLFSKQSLAISYFPNEKSETSFGYVLPRFSHNLKLFPRHSPIAPRSTICVLLMVLESRSLAGVYCQAQIAFGIKARRLLICSAIFLVRERPNKLFERL